MALNRAIAVVGLDGPNRVAYDAAIDVAGTAAETANLIRHEGRGAGVGRPGPPVWSVPAAG
ncbi:hypothetical protein Aglo03_11940 [Actinokineospora globicatena]|uniref:Uncharacterized protein n=1 Tax=Actinokineospora globicatena TaxID=103729 RepID=A0A9W6V8X3_9PSEU|nr:hypothetical protein Aglo03_11940 [Actinokineospora globicatena]